MTISEKALTLVSEFQSAAVRVAIAGSHSPIDEKLFNERMDIFTKRYDALTEYIANLENNGDG